MHWIRDNAAQVVTWVGGLIAAAVTVGVVWASAAHTEAMSADNQRRIRELERVAPTIEIIRDEIRDIKRDVREILKGAK